MRTYSIMCDQCGAIYNHNKFRTALAIIYNHEKTHTDIEQLGKDTSVLD